MIAWAELEAWELMADYRHRISGLRAYAITCWWWLANDDKDGENYFAVVGNDGLATCTGASNSLGVRPAFTI